MYKLIKKPIQDASEIFQAIDVKFAFVRKTNNGEYEQVTSEYKCRDFLGDHIWSRLTNNMVAIYGFKYNYEENPYDLNVLRLSMTFPNIKVKDVFLTNYNKGTDFGFTLTETDQPLTYIIEADTVYQSAVWKLSLFTTALKFMCYTSPDEFKNPENKYWDEYQKYLSSLKMQLNNSKEVLNDNIYVAHGNSGWYSICVGKNNIMKGILCIA